MNEPARVTDEDIEEEATPVGPIEDYHPDHGGDCPGTCDHCGFWLCRRADDVALCDYPQGHPW